MDGDLSEKGSTGGDGAVGDVWVLESEPGSESAGVGAAEDDDLRSAESVETLDGGYENGEVCEGLATAEKVERGGGDVGKRLSPAVEAVLDLDE